MRKLLPVYVEEYGSQQIFCFPLWSKELGAYRLTQWNETVRLPMGCIGILYERRIFHWEDLWKVFS